MGSKSIAKQLQRSVSRQYRIEVHLPKDTTFYDKAARMLKIPRSELERLRPKYNGLVLIENSNDETIKYERVIFTDS